MVDGGGETPGPIPNPEAKPARADGTAPGREWESRLPPTQQLHTQAPATQPFVWRVPFRIPTPAAGCLRVSALRTTPPPPTIGVHPRIVRINTTPPPTQNRPGETQHRRRFVHNRCPAWPPRRPLTLADLRIADSHTRTHHWCTPTKHPRGDHIADNTPAPIIGANLRIADNGGAANYGWTPTDLPSGRWGFAKADNTDLRPGETVAGYRPSSTSTRPPPGCRRQYGLTHCGQPRTHPSLARTHELYESTKPLSARVVVNDVP